MLVRAVGIEGSVMVAWEGFMGFRVMVMEDVDGSVVVPGLADADSVED
jgi:hypothetical protein